MPRPRRRRNGRSSTNSAPIVGTIANTRFACSTALRHRGRRKRRATYGPQVISVLSTIWEAAGYPWSVRLKALLPVWMPWARKRFHLTPRLEQQLLRLSPRTIDYRLRPQKRQLKKRLYGRTKPGTLLKHHIPVKTDNWDGSQPGFTETQ